MSDEPQIEPQLVEVAKDGEVSVVELTAAQGAGESKQTEEESWTPDTALEPPENLDQLARLSQLSQPRSSAVEAIARNTVGLGWEIVRRADSGGDRQELLDAARQLDALAMRDRRLDRPTFSDLLFAVKTDEEECGNGAIEVSRNIQTGEIDGLYHLPGKRLRRLRDRTGYVLQNSRFSAGVEPTDSTTTFYNFGEKVKHTADGKATGSLVDGKSWDVNEVLPFRLYTSESRDYGLPRDGGLSIEYYVAKLADEWNTGYFGSAGTPPSVLFVGADESKTGDGRVRLTIPPTTIQSIVETLRADGSGAKRVAVIPKPNGMKVDHVELGKVSERDIGLNDFRKFHKLNVAGAFRLSPIFIGIVDDAGRYTAEVQRALTLEQVFDPEQRRYEERLGTTLLADLGMADFGIKFKRLAVEGDAARRESADRLAESGDIEIGEHREAHGWPPLNEEEHGEGINRQLVDMGQPRGAEDRTLPGNDHRGLRPGVGGRTRRQPVQKTDSFGGGNGELPPHVEREVKRLVRELVPDA